MIVRRETPDGPEVVAFFAAADQRSASLYPEESRHGLSLPSLLLSEVRFFVARQDGQALGCGGYVLIGADAAEMKRLFIDPAQRGRGVGKALILAIEKAAANEGVKTLLLETGIKSADALRLYKHPGFEVCRLSQITDRIYLAFSW